MKKVGVMQPYLFPYLGYFQLMKSVDEYVIFDDVQFIKRGWINRNNILLDNRKFLVTIALDAPSSNKLINETYIQDDFTKFLKTISTAYARAPYKESVMSLLEKICSYSDKNVARFVGNSLQEMVNYLGLDTKLIYSSEIEQDKSLHAQNKIIAICETLGATEYHNSIGGQELYDRDVFASHDMELKFVKPNLPEYKQLGAEFVPGLSILDVLMFNSVEETSRMLDDYELI